MSVTPKALTGGEIPTKDKVFVEFGGVNVTSPRQSIGDTEFYWLENVMPIGPGNLAPTYAPSLGLQSLVGETVVYSVAANINGTDYIYAVCQSGNAFQILATSPFTKLQIAAGLFSSSTRIAQWDKKGILIIDPTAGYYDWNITGPNVLSAISKALATLTVTPGTGYTSRPTLTFTGGGATTQATATIDLQAVTFAIAAAGANYIVGDILTLSGGTPVTAAQARVTTIGGGGAITGLSVFNPGDYTAIPGNPVATTGGSGNGAATITVTWGIGPANVVTTGSGYAGAPTVTVNGGGGAGGAVVATVNGTMVGTAIATYAGRAWIANGRTVSFTDVGFYNSFGGAGGAFTITDQTLHASITHLFAANSYLYIIGDTSFDYLNNVQVTNGQTTFTRENITASIGTTFPLSVFSYFGALVFANTTGFYALNGTTPQKISDTLDTLFYKIDFTKPMSGGQVFINNILCAAFQFTFTDIFSGTGGSRPILAVFFKGKWCFSSAITTATYAVSVPIGGVSTLFLWDLTAGVSSLNQLFVPGTFDGGVIIRTKLWDGDSPLLDKQIIKAAVGVIAGPASPNMTVYADNEFGTQVMPVFSPAINVYSFNAGSAVSGGGKYFGLTVNTGNFGLTFAMFATQYLETKPW